MKLNFGYIFFPKCNFSSCLLFIGIQRIGCCFVWRAFRKFVCGAVAYCRSLLVRVTRMGTKSRAIPESSLQKEQRNETKGGKTRAKGASLGTKPNSQPLRRQLSSFTSLNARLTLLPKFLFEQTALFFRHLASVICKKLRAIIMRYLLVRVDRVVRNPTARSLYYNPSLMFIGARPAYNPNRALTRLYIPLSVIEVIAPSRTGVPAFK